MTCYIIAEAGTGHFAHSREVRLERIYAFIEAAFHSRASAVKFQMFVPDEPLFCPVDGDEKRKWRWANTAVTLVDWGFAQDWADKLGIDLLWSAFQPTCIEWLKELKPRYVKIATRANESGQFPWRSFPQGTAFIVSAAHGFPRLQPLMDAGYVGYGLKCCPEYPCKLEDAGWMISVPRWDGETYHPSGNNDGLSDHSGTIWPGLDAIYHGAKFLEVHFKIPGADMGNDEPVCLTVEQLKLLCDARDAYARMHP